MKVRILGTRGDIESSAPRHRRRSGVLVGGEVLLDLGEREYLDLAPKAIFISHLHPDHAFFLREPAPSTDIPIYAPERTVRMPGIRVISRAVKAGDFTVTPLPTHHALRVASCAYLVEGLNTRLLYTGDLVWLEKEHHPKLGRLDLVITDGSFIKPGGRVIRDQESGVPYGHNGIPDIAKLFAPFTHRIVFTHFGEWFFEGVRRSRGKIAAMTTPELTVEAAQDDMDIELSEER